MESEKFNQILKDFLEDINRSFPEMHVFEKDIYDLSNIANLEKILEFCKEVYPPIFMDILYKNDSLYVDGIELLPGIDFESMWKSNISDNTKDSIWKYLQLILFFVTNDMDNADLFGDTSKLFEFMNDDMLKEKIQETFENFNELFDEDISGEGRDLPFNPENMHEHLGKLLDGKIGKLAKELAEDAFDDIDLSDDSSANHDMFLSLIKDPEKLKSVMEKISTRLEEKIKSGEINKDEIMSEASDLVKNMKNMPGVESMMRKMAKKNGTKLPSMDSLESIIDGKIKASKQRQRMLERLQKKKEGNETQHGDKKHDVDENVQYKPMFSEEEIIKSFMEEAHKSENTTTKAKYASKSKKKKKKQ